ncbi:MAG: hypothetical protein PVJ57_12730 [Phycisphaerae bacterium]|jgi:hypothetical protein
MNTRKQDFALGLTAIVFLVLFVGTVLFLASTRHGATRTITVHFRHEEGLAPLKPGSLVLLSGALEVGQVTSVEPLEVPAKSGLADERRTVIAVVAEIEERIPLYGNCEISTDMPLVGGSGTMVIVNVGTPDVPLPDGPLQGQPPQGMAAFTTLTRRLTAEGGLVDRVDRMLDPDAEGSLLEKVKFILTDFNAMTAELRAQLSVSQRQTLLGKIHLILDDLNQTTAAVRGQMQADEEGTLLAKVHVALDTVHQNLRELLATLTENRPLLHETLTHVAHATQVIDEEMIAALRAEFDPSRDTSLLGKLHVGLDRLNTSLADMQEMTATGKRLFVLNRPQIEAVIANAREMSEELTAGSKELRLNPSRLIWGPGKPQEGKLDVFMAARDFAQAATFLDDAAARLQAILELAPEGGGPEASAEEIRRIEESLRDAFSRFERAEQFFWEQMK